MLPDLFSSQSTRVLAVVAHADDETILCGGLLARFADHGGAAALVVCGADTHRRAELEAACACLGVAGEALDHRDATLTDADAPALVATVAARIRASKPDIVVTHDPRFDYNPDHLLLGRLVPLAAQKAGMASPDGHRPRLVLAGEIHVPIPFPDMIVDVSAQMPKMLAAMAAHESQLAADHKKGYYSRMLEARCRWRGVQGGVDAAMAFRRLPLPVIGDLYARPQAV